VVAVNGTSNDQNLFNNVYESQTSPMSVYPSSFVVKIYTNNSTDQSSSFNETSYKLYDENGNVVLSRNNLNNYTLYTDTLNNLTPGCYKLIIDDSGCDGYKWWANTAAGNGNVRFENLVIGNIFYNPNGDIGCQLIKYFIVANTTGVTENTARTNEIEIYPNPASGTAYIKFDLNKNQTINYKITDVTGKLIQQKTLSKIEGAYERVDITNFNSGVYFVSVELENKLIITKKLIIQN
jgi:hypothetical protein